MGNWWMKFLKWGIRYVKPIFIILYRLCCPIHCQINYKRHNAIFMAMLIFVAWVFPRLVLIGRPIEPNWCYTPFRFCKIRRKLKLVFKVLFRRVANQTSQTKPTYSGRMWLRTPLPFFCSFALLLILLLSTNIIVSSMRHTTYIHTSFSKAHQSISCDVLTD